MQPSASRRILLLFVRGRGVGPAGSRRSIRRTAVSVRICRVCRAIRRRRWTRANLRKRGYISRIISPAEAAQLPVRWRRDVI